MPVVIATRGSALALAQAHEVAALLRQQEPHLEAEVRIYSTQGDERLEMSLSEGHLEKGLFTREIEAALLRGEAHCAVHSLKDLPTLSSDGLVLSAILPRENPSDYLFTRGPGGLPLLPQNAVVGTGSPRRLAQLRNLRSDLRFCEIRGNVPTRLSKLAKGIDGMQATILAAAGIRRLGLEGDNGCLTFEGQTVWWEQLSWDHMLPAPGQAAIAVQTRADLAEDILDLLTRLDHVATRLCVETERAVLSSIGGGCHLALGALAEVDAGNVDLRCRYFAEGRCVDFRGQAKASEHLALAQQAATHLQNQLFTLPAQDSTTHNAP
ncbi:MAG: hydroxymethylbilane synthase [Verrucomicrobiia bacterium]